MECEGKLYLVTYLPSHLIIQSFTPTDLHDSSKSSEDPREAHSLVRPHVHNLRQQMPLVPKYRFVNNLIRVRPGSSSSNCSRQPSPLCVFKWMLRMGTHVCIREYLSVYMRMHVNTCACCINTHACLQYTCMSALVSFARSVCCVHSRARICTYRHLYCSHMRRDIVQPKIHVST